MSGNTKLIEINGVKFLTHMDWKSEEHHHPLILSMSLKKLAQETGLHYGTTIDQGKQDGNKKRLFQYALCKDPTTMDGFDPVLDDIKTKVLSGAQFVSEHISSWVGSHTGKTIVFIKSVDGNDGGGEFSGKNYWVSATSEKGHVVGEFDLIVNDRFNLISLLEDITITEDVVFAILDTEAEIKEDIYAFSDRAGLKRNSVVINLIEQPVFHRIAKNYEENISVIFKESKIKVKKVGFLTLILAASAGAFFIFSYIIQAGSIIQLSSDSSVDIAKNKSSEYSDILQNLKGSSKWTPEEYRKSTLEQFIGDMKFNLYSPLNASLIMREINRSLPRYSAEWEMEKIEYRSGKFLVTYERINSSKGVYFLLDNNIEAFQKNANGLYVAPFSLEDEATRRVYIVKPNLSLTAQFESEEMLTDLRSEAKLTSLYQRSVKSAKDAYDDIIMIHVRYESLNFSDKWLNMQANVLSNDMDDTLDRIEKLDKRKARVEKKIKELKPLVLDESLILGNIMDFVTMMQLDSLFEWSYPKVSHTYPDKIALKDRNYAKASASDYGPAIEAYEVVINTLSSEEEGKIKSYGMADMVSLGVLIDKPYIHTRSIIYDKKNDQWDFTIHFNKKTNEYDLRVSETNKEVK